MAETFSDFFGPIAEADRNAERLEDLRRQEARDQQQQKQMKMVEEAIKAKSSKFLET